MVLWCFLFEGMAAMKGLAAKRKLLKGLKPQAQQGKTTIYRKSGGLNQMIKDFRSVNPHNVNDHKVSIVQKKSLLFVCLFVLFLEIVSVVFFLFFFVSAGKVTFLTIQCHLYFYTNIIIAVK